jgi:hypothetical protein
MADREGRGTSWSLRGPELVGVLLIGIGIIYFLGNANLIRINWGLLWPVLVIALGLLILYSAMRPRGATASTLQVPRDDVQQLELDLQVGGGEFHLAGGSDQLVDVRSNRDDIESRVDRQGTRGRIRLRQDAAWWPFRGGSYARWDLKLPADVATALTIQGGAGSFDADLSALRVVDARLTFGAAQARITLPHPTGEVAVKVSSGAASVTIQVPPGVEATVKTSGGLLQVEGRTETPGYATARDRVTVSVTGGASQIRVI